MKFYKIASTGSIISTAPKTMHAIRTGEKRPPKKGEWFLSGAIPQAYKALNDLDTPYHILKLVKTKTEIVISIDE